MQIPQVSNKWEDVLLGWTKGSMTWGVSRVQPSYLSNSLHLDQQKGSKGEEKKKNERKRVFNNHPFISLPALSLVKEPILPKALEVWQLEKVGPWILMGFLSLLEDCWALKRTSVIHSKCCWPRWNCFLREYKASSSKTHLRLGTLDHNLVQKCPHLKQLT